MNSAAASENRLLPLIGVYDVFSAKIVAERFEGVFCSGYGYAASAYGLPDVGYVNWRDMADFATKIRHAIPTTHILVDVDDGFGDQVVAANTIRILESNGLSAVMMEDQKRPRRCGHFEGKEILPREEYLTKLPKVIETRQSLFVIARTDAGDPSEGPGLRATNDASFHDNSPRLRPPPKLLCPAVFESQNQEAQEFRMRLPYISSVARELACPVDVSEEVRRCQPAPVRTTSLDFGNSPARSTWEASESRTSRPFPA